MAPKNSMVYNIDEQLAGNATITRINNIDPTDLILNGVEGTQLVSGSKTFAENLQVKGDVETSLVNGVNISSEYSSGVQNGEDVEITGDLVKLVIHNRCVERRNNVSMVPCG